MSDVLRQQFAGASKCWATTDEAFDQDMYFSTRESSCSKRKIRLNIHNMLLDAAVWLKTLGVSVAALEAETDGGAAATSSLPLQQPAIGMQAGGSSVPPANLMSVPLTAGKLAQRACEQSIASPWSVEQQQQKAAAIAAGAGVNGTKAFAPDTSAPWHHQAVAMQMSGLPSLDDCTAASVTHIPLDQLHQLGKLDGMLQHRKQPSLQPGMSYWSSLVPTHNQ